MSNLSRVLFPAACCDKSELNPKNVILRGLPRGTAGQFIIGFFSTRNVGEPVKSQFFRFTVILAKSGIQ
jgi:hypothetical protein